MKNSQWPFISILIFLCLLDIFLLKDCQNWSVPLVVVFLQLTLLIIVGQRLKIDFVVSLVEALLKKK